jgi:hypothetical protein
MTPVCRVQLSQISLQKTVCRIIHEDVRKNVGCAAVSLTPLWHAQRYHWHRCATNFVDYLTEFEAVFEKTLTRVWGVQGNLFDEKTRGRKSRVRAPLRKALSIKSTKTRPLSKLAIFQAKCARYLVLFRLQMWSKFYGLCEEFVFWLWGWFPWFYPAGLCAKPNCPSGNYLALINGGNGSLTFPHLYRDSLTRF